MTSATVYKMCLHVCVCVYTEGKGRNLLGGRVGVVAGILAAVLGRGLEAL